MGPRQDFEDVLLIPACWGLCSWVAMIKPSVSALRPAAFSHLWVLSWSTSAGFTRCRYLPWSAFDSHPWPELLVTVVFGLGLCSAGIGGVRLILYRIIIIIIITIMSSFIFSLVIIINLGLRIDVGA